MYWRILIGKTEEFIPAEGRWWVYYLGFARGRWTDAAGQFASNFHHKTTGENWQRVGIELITLEQVDNDLSTWSLRVDLETGVSITVSITKVTQGIVGNNGR